MEKKPNDQRNRATVHATPETGGNQADKAKGNGDDEIDAASVSGREPGSRTMTDNPTDRRPPVQEPPPKPDDDGAGGTIRAQKSGKPFDDSNKAKIGSARLGDLDQAD